MKLLLSVLVMCTIQFSAFAADKYVSPLSHFSAEWNNEKYQVCNTAADVKYMSATEKEVIHILNLARMNPSLFNSTVVKQFPAFSNQADLNGNSYYQSLQATMQHMPALNILTPSQPCFESALCHAQSSGVSGYVGHDRRTAECEKKKFFFGECCDYGHADALGIVMALLIDRNIPSLGHRKIFFGKYNTVGVSIQPHKAYRSNAVIDFGI
ncbi:MAG: hypothetical protein JWQ27_1353 [Ferruginibacter sp.]|nr:hypothetical protein [Ferruginibacter sp.]